ncbi:hypothetical protein CIB48_g5250 [Xylaria polymorpha]|nr:hypothetical protein CIB48_g5250 [Xylaria polymorpha]
MGSFDVGGIETPAGGFEGSGIEEAVVYSDESLANAVGDLGKVTGSQSTRKQTTYSSTWIKDIVDVGTQSEIVGTQSEIVARNEALADVPNDAHGSALRRCKGLEREAVFKSPIR